jgi:hypothetical protein
MLIKEKSWQDRQRVPVENRAMVSAIFGAVADFAASGTEIEGDNPCRKNCGGFSRGR